MKNKLFVLAMAGTLATALPVFSQHEHHHPAKDSTKTAAETNVKQTSEEHVHEMSMNPMTHSYSLSLPMTRNGSGTGWQPDATPMYAYMKHAPKWNFMLHGSLFARFTSQNFNNAGKRGSASGLSFPNWLMGMAQRQTGKNGLLTVRTMLSLDRLTDGGDGYPLLFQSGESWKGVPLINRQHPHDLISELSIGYAQRINNKVDLSIYAGYPGEPALGPIAFMHRMSAFNNPDAVLGHHWQDATHITFGVMTLGVRYGKFKLEGSGFTGREPDENRFNFDKPRFDSYSYRLLFNPSKNWALQASRGYIKSPEPAASGENINRTTASIQHSLTFPGNERWISSTLVWGLNGNGGHHKEHSALAESNLQLNKWAVYGRYEFVQKSAHELGLETSATQDIFPVSAFTLGTNRRIAAFAKTLLQLGGQISIHNTDRSLEKDYGRTPLSGQFYLRLTPAFMKM